MPRMIVSDPRDPSGEAELPVDFHVLSPGLEPHGYGRDFDPGCGPEIALRSAFDVCSVDVLPTLSVDDLETIEAEIVARFDFRPSRH